MKPILMCEVIDRKRYDTNKADVIAGNDWWDGHNFERSGRQMFLFRTKRGSYFLQHLTQWQGERDRIEPVSLEDAAKAWEELTEHRMSFEMAFPLLKVEEA